MQDDESQVAELSLEARRMRDPVASVSHKLPATNHKSQVASCKIPARHLQAQRMWDTVPFGAFVYLSLRGGGKGGKFEAFEEGKKEPLFYDGEVAAIMALKDRGGGIAIRNLQLVQLATCDL